jgi:TonB family protein
MRIAFACLTMLSLLSAAPSQSGVGRPRERGDYGVNLTFAIYQYDPSRSPEMARVTRLAQTFSSAEEEAAHLRDKHKLEDVVLRHIRSVGLLSGETFADAILLGPDYMILEVRIAGVARRSMSFDFKASYGGRALLDVSGIELENFETAILRGDRGQFGLVSVTPEIVPTKALRNRPEELSQPTDQYGKPIELKPGDKFTPPIAVERVVPKFEVGQRVNGSVLLGGIVTPEGRIINVRVIRSLDPQMDQRAVEAFKQYRFSPALLNGKPTCATYREEVTFAGGPSPLELLRERQEQRDKKKAGKRPISQAARSTASR